MNSNPASCLRAWRHPALLVGAAAVVAACDSMPSMPMMGHMGSHHGSHMMMRGGPTNTVDAATLPDKDSPGAQAFTRYCQQCHALPSPTQHAANEWPAVVERMRGNMRNMGKNVADDKAASLIVDYLKRNARAAQQTP